MCDVFGIAAGTHSKAQHYLPAVARKAAEPMNGWGLGFFRNGQAGIETSAGQAPGGGKLQESWQRLTRLIDSPIIVSQISCPLDCGRSVAENRPVSLSFFEHSWLFVHVGRVDRIAGYQTLHAPGVAADIYPARILEYLRDQLLAYMGSNPYGNLHKGLSYAIRCLSGEYPGRYTFLLANESVLFAFCNANRLMVLREPATLGKALLITSLDKGPERPRWTPIRPGPNGAGKLVTIAGPDILQTADI